MTYSTIDNFFTIPSSRLFFSTNRTGVSQDNKLSRIRPLTINSCKTDFNSFNSGEVILYKEIIIRAVMYTNSTANNSTNFSNKYM